MIATSVFRLGYRLICDPFAWVCAGLVAAVLAMFLAASSIGTLHLGSLASSPEERAFCMRLAWTEIYDYDLQNLQLPHDVRLHDGNRVASWRFVVAAPDMLEAPADKNAAWNAPQNTGAARSPYPAYCFDLRQTQDGLSTKVLAVSGEGTAFDQGVRYSLKDLPKDLILLVERWGTGIHWMEPADLDLKESATIPLDGADGKGCFVAFADGAVWFLRSDTPQDAIRRFCTIKGAQEANRKALLGGFAEEFRGPVLR